MRFSDQQLRGAVLEEVVLYILTRSGYSPVGQPGTDPLMRVGRAGLELRGRGAWHQLDSIADFRITPPFSNPIRLIVEAKCQALKVGLPVVRNSTGVLKDLCENWVVEPDVSGLPARPRHHYLCSIFSATEFTEPAQQYAYAQDIVLVPLARSSFIATVIREINHLTVEAFDEGTRIADVRASLRQRLMQAVFQPGHDIIDDALDPLIQACFRLRYGAIAMLGGRFPAFLVAAPANNLWDLPPTLIVRIGWQNDSWFIEDTHGQRIFSFDLPEELFRLYAEAGMLDRRTVANLKGEMLSSFHAYVLSHDGELRITQFLLDPEWYNEVKQRLGMVV